MTANQARRCKSEPAVIQQVTVFNDHEVVVGHGYIVIDSNGAANSTLFNMKGEALEEGIVMCHVTDYYACVVSKTVQ